MSFPKKKKKKKKAGLPLTANLDMTLDLPTSESPIKRSLKNNRTRYSLCVAVEIKER
jgi:hypothetical protein